MDIDDVPPGLLVTIDTRSITLPEFAFSVFQQLPNGTSQIGYGPTYEVAFANMTNSVPF